MDLPGQLPSALGSASRIERPLGRGIATGTLLALVVLGAPRSILTAQTSPDEREIRQHEENWCVALKTRNPGLLDGILAPDYVEVTSSGAMLTRAEAIAGVADPESSTTGCGNSGLEIRIYGDAAVASGIMDQAGTVRGKAYSGKRIVFTDTYIRRNGRWRCVAGQSTLTTPSRGVTQ